MKKLPTDIRLEREALNKLKRIIHVVEKDGQYVIQDSLSACVLIYALIDYLYYRHKVYLSSNEFKTKK